MGKSLNWLERRRASQRRRQGDFPKNSAQDKARKQVLKKGLIVEKSDSTLRDAARRVNRPAVRFYPKDRLAEARKKIDKLSLRESLCAE